MAPRAAKGSLERARALSPVQRQLITITASPWCAASASMPTVVRARRLPEMLKAVEELRKHVERKYGLLAMSEKDLLDEAGRAWVSDARAASASSAPALVTANANRASMAWVCRHLWHAVLRSARADGPAAGEAEAEVLARAAEALAEIAIAYANIHIFIPSFDFRERPTEEEADAFRQAIVPVVRRRMSHEADEMARRACELAVPYMAGESDNEPLLDLSTTIVLPLSGSCDEAAAAGWDATQAKHVRRFAEVYAYGPVRVAAEVVTNRFCKDERAAETLCLAAMCI